MHLCINICLVLFSVTYIIKNNIKPFSDSGFFTIDNVFIFSLIGLAASSSIVVTCICTLTCLIMERRYKKTRIIKRVRKIEPKNTMNQVELENQDFD